MIMDIIAKIGMIILFPMWILYDYICLAIEKLTPTIEPESLGIDSKEWDEYLAAYSEDFCNANNITVLEERFKAADRVKFEANRALYLFRKCLRGNEMAVPRHYFPYVNRAKLLSEYGYDIDSYGTLGGFLRFYPTGKNKYKKMLSNSTN